LNSSNARIKTLDAHKEVAMRFMFLNHSYQRHSAELEAHIMQLLKSYASPDTTFE